MKFPWQFDHDDDEVIVAKQMSDEQMEVAHDLTAKTLNTMSIAIRDHIQLADHPAQTYIMLTQAAKLIVNGFALYHPVAGLDKHGKVPENNHQLDRMRYSLALVFLMLADDHGFKEARTVLKRTLQKNIDGRELMRFIAGMKFS